MRAPVREPAKNPARDLRGARGSPRRLRGRGGVSEPQRRPMVEAAVSAHERLSSRAGRVSMMKGGDKGKGKYIHKDGYNC